MGFIHDRLPESVKYHVRRTITLPDGRKGQVESDRERDRRITKWAKKTGRTPNPDPRRRK